MSNRALRKAMQKSVVNDQNNDSKMLSGDTIEKLEESGDSDIELDSQKSQKKNLFDLLALEDANIDVGENDEDAFGVVDEDVGKNVSSSSKDTSKKKKKQKKKRMKKDNNENKDGANLDDDQFDLDSYAKEMAELRKRMEEQDIGDGATAKGGFSCERGILSVDHRYLDADYELARVFGKSFVRDETSKRVVGRMPGAGLVRPKVRWPVGTHIGLSMRKVDETDDERGDCGFIVEHNKEYRAVEDKFHEALHSHNPNNLQDILRRQPYHVNTLLQMCDVFRMEEDYDTAADFAERAVFAFTRSAHPMFNVPAGRCRLDYRYDENRGFFVALFLHIQFLARRGCYRTGLEFCKVLLSLNPKDDPLATILMIDHFSIMGGELEYLLQVYNEWQTYKNLNQLPNFVFSCALARFRLKDKLTDGDDGTRMLQDALLRYPGWLHRLLDKCGVVPDDRVKKSQYFMHDSAESEGLIRLYDIHIGRTSHLWKEPEVLLWLETTVKSVLDIVEAAQDKRIKEYTEYRARRYQKTPKSVLRHIYLSSIPGVTFSMPSNIESGVITSFDPFPPKDAITLYPRPTRRRRAQLETGFLGPLLNSMLPTYDPQEETNENPNGGRMALSVEILETIRQLVNGIQPAPPPVANGQNVEDAEPEDD